MTFRFRVPGSYFSAGMTFPVRGSLQHGSALLIVLWAVAMMSMTVLDIVEYVHYDLDQTTALEKEFRARQIAEAGLAVGLHPLVKRGEKLLSQDIGPGETFVVQLRSEGGRLNINTILQNNQWQFLHDLYVLWGLNEADATQVTDAFELWTTPAKWQELTSSGNRVRSFSFAGMTGTAATRTPRRQFQSLEEMLRIPGMNLVVGAKPDWWNYFTIWNDGKLDMNEAPADLIKVVCHVGGLQALRLVNSRLGPDGLPDTDDDLIFQDLEQVRQQLGMSQSDFAKIQDRLSVQDSVTRVESTGTLGAYQRKIVVIARKNLSPPTYFQWQEL